jgi:glycosyltransferase involved in cell wall biosynthesis
VAALEVERHVTPPSGRAGAWPTGALRQTLSSSAALDVAARRLALLQYAKARIGRPGPLPRQRPRVSVVVPCYNYGHYIPACVESVLTQPGVDADILIIDDASPDGSAAAVTAAAERDPRVRAICHTSNRGHIATYNEGLGQVDGDYVVLLSADDLLAPGSLRRATALMVADPAVGLVYGPAADFSGTAPAPDGSARRATSWTIWPGHDWLEDRCRTGRNALRSPEAVMRASVLRAAGEYNAALPHAGDFEMWMRAASIADVGYVAGATQAYYRVHEANMHNVVFGRDDPKGTVVDLEQRYECFVSVFQDNASLPQAEALLRRARRTLAREALTLAIRCYEWGTADAWPVAELASFAERMCPPAEVRSLWRALALRRRVGAARSRRHPLFLPGEQVYKAADRLNEWRWRYAGL